MKAAFYSQQGERKSDIELPNFFTTSIREDLVAKAIEAERQEQRQPYASFAEAGKHHSASGVIRHKRHAWKVHYGKGMARLPRKIMWRRGIQFYWVGAEVANTRGGRRAHPPKGMHAPKKINAKEAEQALRTAFAATCVKEYLFKRYTSLAHQNLLQIPAVIESLPSKTKDLLHTLKKMYGSLFYLVVKKKEVRAGKGKLRGRTYKTNAGLLIVVGSTEKVLCSAVDIKSLKNLSLLDLIPLGRLTLYTQQALKELAAQEE